MGAQSRSGSRGPGFLEARQHPSTPDMVVTGSIRYGNGVLTFNDNISVAGKSLTIYRNQIAVFVNGVDVSKNIAVEATDKGVKGSLKVNPGDQVLIVHRIGATWVETVGRTIITRNSTGEVLGYVAVDTTEPWIPPKAASAKIPVGWDMRPNKKGTGYRFTGPSGQLVRIDKGSPDSPWPSQRVDHVVVQTAPGKILDGAGKVIDAASPASTPQAHIPLSAWMGWSAWNHP